MKKLLGLVLSLVLLLSSTAAYAEYAGDVQLNAGYSYLSVDFEHGSDECSDNLAIGIANHNLWKVSDLISIGFMENVDIGLGNTDNDNFLFEFNMLIGPSVSFNISQNININLSSGFVGGGVIVNGEDESSIDWIGFGYGTDAHVKFFATKFISPILGLSFVHFTSDEMTLTVSNHGYDFDVESSTSIFKIYAGASFNF